MNNNNTYFTKEIFSKDIDLETNDDVLERIYGDNVKPTDKLSVEFWFLTDTEIKAIVFKDVLIKTYPEYLEIKVEEYDGDYEISGITNPLRMNLETINNWNIKMWDIGYIYDCKLDGWQVGT